MADVTLNIHCGCGYRTGRLEEAVGHSDTTHHIIDISGIIRPVVSKAANKAASKPVSKVSPIRPQRYEELASDSVSAIQALRAQFGKK